MGNTTSCFVDVFAGDKEQATASSTARTEDGTPITINPTSRRTPSGRISARSVSVGHTANGVVPKAELQSNLKELDRILASLEEDLQELHTTPTTAKETRKALNGVRMPGVPSAADAAAEQLAPPPPPPPPPSVAAAQSQQPDRVSHSIVVTGEEEAPAETEEGEVVEDQGERMPHLFSSQPKHAGHGLVNGVRDIGLGVAGGVAALFAAPMVGAQKEGSSGFFKMARGVYNTPEAMGHVMAADAVWDEATGRWSNMSILERHAMCEREFARWQRDNKEATAKAEAHDAGGARPAVNASTVRGHSVKDMELYEVLGVKTEASAGEIKKAYYRMAMITHPDKHKDDPQAKAKFQRIGEAYQVLGNEQSRARYDKNGKAGIEPNQMVDPALLFTLMFGGEQFEPFFGELAVASVAAAAMDPAQSKNIRTVDLDRIQRRRQAKLAVELAQMLQPSVLQGATADEEGAVADAMRATAAYLKRQPFGGAIMSVMGRVYYTKAQQHISTMPGGGMLAEWLEAYDSIGTQYSVAQAAYHAYTTHQQVTRLRMENERMQAGAEGNPDQDKEQCKRRAEESVRASQSMQSSFLHALWMVTQLDIETTLRGVTELVLTDPGVSHEQRLQRAKALSLLGTIFMEQGEAKVDVAQMQQEMMKAGVRASEKQQSETEQRSSNSTS